MIRRSTDADFPTMLSIVNEAAEAYRGVIPADRWHEPYMSNDHLEAEMRDGVRFVGYDDDGLVGVMGIQDRGDVHLIRHAYVRTSQRRRGIGEALIKYLEEEATKPRLIGTWAAATWAIRFYEKHGYRVLSREDTVRLLKKYWNIPERQVETSVVLASPAFR